MEELENDREVSGLFNSYEGKTEPLFVCKGNNEGIMYKIQPDILCPITPIKEKSKVVTITIFFESIGLNPIPAFECWAVKEVERKSFFFWGSYSETKSSSKVPVSPTQCQIMVNDNVAPNGQPLQAIMEGYYSTNEKLKTEWSWPITDEKMAVV